MKRIKIYSYILVLFLFITLTNVGKVNALSENDFDNPTFEYSSDSFLYKEINSSINSKKQSIFYGEYLANADSKYEWVIHSVRDGSKTTRTTVLDIAKDFEEKTGQKVVFASNGDYFDLNTGSNMESYVNQGIVISKGSFATKHCIGFDNLGKVAIGRMTEVEQKINLVVGGKNYLYKIDKYNEAPLQNEIAIYNKAGTYTLNEVGVYIITSTSSNLSQLPVWGESKKMTKGEKITSSSFTLKSGQFAVVLKDGAINDYFFENIKYGVEVDLVETPSGDFTGCSWVLGGYDILVNNYVQNTTCHTDNDGSGNAPRTFIGFKEDGTCFVCVVDGRQPLYSVGISVNEEASLAKSLGAKYALELDGGGSSTVVLRIDDVLTLRNKPSDGKMRTVSNAIMLVEKATNSSPDDTPTDPVNPPKNTGCSLSKGINVVVSTLSMVCIITTMVLVGKTKKGR